MAAVLDTPETQSGFANKPVIDPVTGLPKETVLPSETPWIGSQGQIADTMAGKVAEISSKDSPLNQMARTEGLKAANRRGLLNSSMAVGASQDAVLQNALPIASQDAAQAFQKNMAARGFEYGMTAQEQQQGFVTSERLGTQAFVGAQAGLDRALQTDMQIRQIAATKGLQEADIAFRMKEGGLDRAAAVVAQNKDLAHAVNQNALTRSLQLQIAKMNLSATERAGAAQFVTNMETMYQTAFQSIMSNPNLDAATRSTFLDTFRIMRDHQLNLVEQIYHVDLTWN